MNREIKFKVWDKKYEKFATACEFHDQDLMLTLDGKVLFGSSADMSHHFELLQYTGLQDKNGVEIYEGDVLASDVDPKLLKWLVVHNGYAVCVRNLPYSHARFPIDSISYFSERVVIGNQFENPELLEVTR